MSLTAPVIAAGRGGGWQRAIYVMLS